MSSVEAFAAGENNRDGLEGDGFVRRKACPKPALTAAPALLDSGAGFANFRQGGERDFSRRKTCLTAVARKVPSTTWFAARTRSTLSALATWSALPISLRCIGRFLTPVFHDFPLIANGR
jgi:hypothetical protein